MICSRSFATLAVRFFSPSRNESKDISRSPPTEHALEEAGALRVGEAQRDLLAEEAPDHVLVRLRHLGALQVNRRQALVRGIEHGLRLRDYADELDAQDLLDILQRQHLPAFDAVRVVARDEQMLLHRLLAFDRTLGLGGQ